MNAKKHMDAMKTAILDGAPPALLDFFDKHQEKLEKVNPSMSVIFGLCIAEFTKAGFSDEEIGILAALTAQAGKAAL